MSNIFTLDEYNVTTILIDNSIYFRVIDTNSLKTYEHSIQMSDINMSCNKNTIYTFIFNCFSKMVNHNVIFLEKINSLKIKFNIIYDDFFDINFNIILPEKKIEMNDLIIKLKRENDRLKKEINEEQGMILNLHKNINENISILENKINELKIENNNFKKEINNMHIEINKFKKNDKDNNVECYMDSCINIDCYMDSYINNTINNFDMSKYLKNGEKIRHILRDSTWYAAYDLENNKLIINDEKYNSPQDFLRAHFKYLKKPIHKTADGWKECECYRDGKWIPIYDA